MTKSTITRERLEQLADNNTICKVSWDERIELAQIALSAMDSEPVAYADPQAFENFEAGNARREWMWKNPGADLVALYRHAQPVPEYPETLPCPVLLEPGLRFGKGIKTSTMLAALARRAVHESDMAALSPEERAEFQAGIEGVKALIAHPATAFPDFDNVLENLDYEVRCNAWESEHVLKACQATYDACRAAMLSGGKS